MNHYQLLGIQPSATLTEIKKAFRVQAQLNHPDRNGGDLKYVELFKKINIAYEVLRDPDKRQAYDLKIRVTSSARSTSSNSKTSSTTDSKSTRTETPKVGTPGADFHTKEVILLTLKQAVLGCEITHTFKGPPPESKTVRFTTKFPPNLHPGPRKAPKMGFPSKNGGEPGTAFIPVKVMEDPKFAVKGLDVHVNLRISVVEAAVGVGIKFADFLGKPVNVTIPRGIKDGQVLTFKGRGIPMEAVLGARKSGNLKVNIRISRPGKVSEKAKQLIKELNLELFGKDIRGA